MTDEVIMLGKQYLDAKQDAPQKNIANKKVLPFNELKTGHHFYLTKRKEQTKKKDHKKQGKKLNLYNQKVMKLQHTKLNFQNLSIRQ